MGPNFGIFVVFLACFNGAYSAAQFATAPNHFGQLYYSKSTPRGLFVDESGDLLGVSEADGTVFAITEIVEDDGTINLLESQLVNSPTYGILLTHSVVHHQGYLYASTDAAVYRWRYVAGSHDIGTHVPAETVINNISPGGRHVTRTLVFENQTMNLYVSIGSINNTDTNSERARIKVFDLANARVFPIDWNDGVIYADGLRNNVGFGFDLSGILWGVENGADDLFREDLGGDIHNTNPAEELNRFDGPTGTHYGYPYCFSTDILEGYDPLTQFAWPTTMDDGVHDDAWCQTVDNNRVPHLAIPAHTAPLGIVFYDGRGCDTAVGAFPCDMIGDAFVALHGSWNSDIKVGYKVIRLPFTKTEPFLPTGEQIDVIWAPDSATCGGTGNCLRPVNVVFNHNGHLILSADLSSELFKVTYGVPPAPIRKR